MEPHRLWHEPEVIIYGNLITPGIRSSAEAYDLGNRRWYQFNISPEMDDDELMSQIVEQHISKHYHAHGTIPPFNVINTTLDGISTTYETKPDNMIARPIRKTLTYDPQVSPFITVTDCAQLIDKSYLGRGVDRCVWNKRDCVFKRIEFDVDVEAIEREIQAREKLMMAMDNDISIDIEDLMQRNFNIIPILAVVVRKENSNEIMGILMPFIGPSLASMVDQEQAPAEFSTESKDIAISVAQIRDLARGVHEFSRHGIVHGDINERNTLLSSASQEPSRMVLCDLGSIAPEYRNDAFALGELLLWCNKHASVTGAGSENVDAAANILQSTGNFDGALQLLGYTGKGVNPDQTLRSA